MKKLIVATIQTGWMTEAWVTKIGLMRDGVKSMETIVEVNILEMELTKKYVY
ncbi:MAG: hypothetical protein ACJAWW_002731 [Sulfurimonas sp.]|jgi:hypothetical protein